MSLRVRRALAARLVAALLVALAALLGELGVAAPAAATPGPPNAPEYWFDSWHIEDLWAQGLRGQGITIAEIDTGVNAQLPALAGRIRAGTDLGAGGDGRTDRDLNAFGHGTAMASIMVARPGLLGITGIAPDARILPIAVPLRGTSDAGKPDHLSDAIRYAADHGARIINMSLGGLRDPKSDASPCPDAEQQAVYYAMAKGAVVVASVGNTGPRRNVVEDPAACLGVVSVGATDAAGGVASFSAREPYLTLVAPGVSVPSLGRFAGDAFSGDGTSQATAIVSAALAVAWSADRSVSATRMVARMLATLDLHRSTPSSTNGYGLLDLYRLVTTAVPADAPNPVYTLAEPFRRRDDALRFVSPTHPPPAATAPARADGTYAVGGHTRVTGDVVRGGVLAAVGLLGLLVLTPVGIRRNRARRRGRAVIGSGLAPVADPVPAGPPVAPVAPAPPTVPPAPPVPRPRPRPGPPD